ncbi:MAG: hypothetical protein NTU83_15400 [Candidatus Hydrogenedentes bacterium]|nr:hypothetical protein [Candidatus Hydrogenedentota bacterium]
MNLRRIASLSIACSFTLMAWTDTTPTPAVSSEVHNLDARHVRLDHAQVVLSWDDTGDFGPATANTKTAGWQEAIDYCVANARDLYVKGGWGGRKAIYHVSDMIRIPATQNFRIDGGVYVLNWTGAADDPEKDLMRIDSTMNGEYHFGIFVYGGAGAGLRIRPENPVPIDGFAVFTETEIKSQGIADPAPFTPGERKAGVGLSLDGTRASIVCNRFDFIGGILNFKTCIETRGAFVQNHFDCLHLHTNASNSTLFAVGPQTSQNKFALTIGVDQGATDVLGVVVAGFNNSFEIVTRGGFIKAHDIVLEESAKGNRFDVVHGKAVFEPSDFVTDHGSAGANRVTGTGLAGSK